MTAREQCAGTPFNVSLIVPAFGARTAVTFCRLLGCESAMCVHQTVLEEDKAPELQPVEIVKCLH